ncbi:MAG: hypothetical protein AAFV07_13030 [Bacteroidota bacterium]
MYSWSEFQQVVPLLQRIEARFARLRRFEAKYPPNAGHIHGFTEEDIQHAKEALMTSLQADAEAVSIKMYYWLYPFYPGDFMCLVAAMGAAGAMEKQQDDPASRKAFYNFFRTVPMEERLQLGARLNNPELSEQAARIQAKIKAKRSEVKGHMDTFHAN